MAAFSIDNGRRRGERRYRPMAEINVTPFVDVMLVLLVIFMIAAPLLTVGVPVHLPRTHAPAIAENTEPLVISVDAAGTIFISNSPVSTDSLVPRLEAITGANPNAILYVRGDREINYGRVLEVMSLISAAGFRKVSLIAEPATGAKDAGAGLSSAQRAER
jgi:biopolymer transport protein TolR